MLYKIIATTILALFYSCYFIKMFLQKQKGIQTDQIGKGKVGIVRFIEITMKTTTILTPIIEIISIYFTPTNTFVELIRILGAFIGISGVAIFVCSVITMRDNWRAGIAQTDKTELVTNGIYRVSRNPAFLGFDLVYIGLLCMFFNPLLLVSTILAITMLHLQIVLVEEKFLINSFGDEYSKYKSEVCRYLGLKIYRK